MVLRPLALGLGLALTAGLVTFTAAPAIQQRGPVVASGPERAIVQVLPGPPTDDGERSYAVDVLTDAEVASVQLLVDGAVVDETDTVIGGTAALSSNQPGTVSARVTMASGAVTSSAGVAAAPSTGRLAALGIAGDARTVAEAADRLGVDVEDLASALRLDPDDTLPGVRALREPRLLAWDGPARLVDGFLQLDAPDVTRAFVYVSDDEQEWHRVPALDGTAVTRGPDGTFDLRQQLPALDGDEVTLEVWRSDIDVVPVGTSTARAVADEPPDQPTGPFEFTGGTVTAFEAGLTGRVTLGFIEREGVRGVDEALVESTRIDADRADELAFRWASDVPGVTHVVWQAFANTGPAGPVSLTDPTIVRYGVSTPDQDGRFVFVPPTPVDLSDQLDMPTIEPAVMDHAALLGGTAPSPGVGSVDGPGTASAFLGGAYLASAGTGAWVVRALAFAGDTYLGIASNDVTVHVGPPRADSLPEPGEYRLQLTVHPPQATDPTYANCYVVTDIDPARPAAPGDQWAAAEYTILAQAIAQRGPQICWEYCYDNLKWPMPWGGSSITVTGDWGPSGRCSSSNGGFLDAAGSVAGAVGGVVISGYDLVVDTYNGAKAWAVDAVVDITLCKQVASAQQCSAAANAVVTGAMMSVGLPPSLPDRDELIASAKGDLAAALASLAEATVGGCGELQTADAVAGTGLTCEQLAAQLIEEVTARIADVTRSSARQSGFPFPPGVTVVPDSRAVAQSTVVELTTIPEAGERLGPGCIALVNSSMRWDAEGLFAARLPFHKDSFDHIQGDWFVPLGSYGGQLPPMAVSIPLPAASDQPATVSFTLPSSSLSAAVEASRWNKVFLSNDNYQVTDTWSVPGVHMAQQEGATIEVSAASTCAGSATASAKVLPPQQLLTLLPVGDGS